VPTTLLILSRAFTITNSVRIRHSRSLLFAVDGFGNVVVAAACVDSI
jgi:hypothetical protein